MQKLKLIFNTIRYLKPVQFWARFSWILKTRLFRPIIIFNTNRSFPNSSSPKLNLVSRPVARSVHRHDVTIKRFSFLNQEYTFTDEIHWNHSALEKLWLYNLHYFDYLIPLTYEIKSSNFENGKKIIIHWVENNPTGIGNGWEPYPLSLRIANWIFFYAAYAEYFEKEGSFKEQFLASLYRQTYYLTHFLEFHIQANHLFENVKAFWVAGIFFQNPGWIKQGWKLFKEQLREQVLPDGGHYERSPMYHSIILLGVLDVLNVLKANDLNPNSETQQNASMLQIDQREVEEIEKVAERMLAWFQNMQHPDREIALFGDSAFNIAPCSTEIEKYYWEVIGKKVPKEHVNKAIFLKDSGYSVHRTKEHYFVIDGGELGVRYQPGHTHCDLFSYEYSYSGLRFIVDSGVGNYQETTLRQKARSIYAHNTVVVNGIEQAEMWKVFRVGRWVKPLNVDFQSIDDRQIFQGEYYNRLSKVKQYYHRRRVTLCDEKFFVIEDIMNGRNINSIESLIHFHPDCSFQLYHNYLVLNRNENSIRIIWKEQQVSVSIADWFYVPEFGIVLNSHILILKPNIENTRKLCYVITPSKYVEAAEKIIDRLLTEAKY